MSQINFEDETLDASDGVTRLLLAAEYWKEKATTLRAELEKAKSVPMKYRRMEFNAQLQNENTRLRAKLDALKAQEPVAWMKDQWSPDCGNYWELCREDEMGWRDRKDWVPLYARPVPAQSVPDGFREGAEAAARLIDQKAELYATRFGHDNTGGISFGQGPHAESKMDHYTGLLELADELRAALAAAPKPEVK